MIEEMRAYSPLDERDVRLRYRREEEACERSLLIFETPFGYRRTAELFRPAGDGPFPLILYIHWYEPSSSDSNRSQFVQDALEMTRAGALCLAVETLWSDPDFFLKRTQADDLENSRQEVVNERRFIDYLLSQPGADPGRFALVGHDFGGMYGVLAGSLDGRPTHYIIMAATPRFPDWYLYAPKLEGTERETFIQSMAPLDPISHVAKLAPRPILFQFGTDDPHVPRERAEEFFATAIEPKDARFYNAGHGLNEQARLDRVAWLKERLR